ncbi:hypothetical protein GGS20DRAFT_586956 [Poronia punctata]|nr:hypothetical protein GGS20DRAFT_586956 [Poronia punctata]
MTPIRNQDNGAMGWDEIATRIADLYGGDFPRRHEDDSTASTQQTAAREAVGRLKGSIDPNLEIPRVISYLSNNDAGRDPDWPHRFALIQAYLDEAHHQMVTGGLGFNDPKLRAALADARVMAKVHQNFQKNPLDGMPWTTDILRGQLTQERLLTYPKAFPHPDPDRSKSRYRPMEPTPRPDDESSSLWNTSLHLVTRFGHSQSQPVVDAPKLVEVDNYVESENRFFHVAQQNADTGARADDTEWQNLRFNIENTAYEQCIQEGTRWTNENAPPVYTKGPTGTRGPQNPDGTKGTPFYTRRGWQRGALQQCLNLFQSHENRVINTPWRRAVLPYEQPVPLPKDIVFAPRVVHPSKLTDGREKDPFSWLRLSSQYTQIWDFLAECQRKRYNNQSWSNFLAPALPANFRGPRIYRGLSVYDQHWLKIGQTLDNLADMLVDAWATAPRPLLRAILRDIDAGRQDQAGNPQVNNSRSLPSTEDDRLQEQKRLWRRDIKRRPGIDTQEDSADDGSYKLVDEHDIAWLRYLCRPSRTLDMCDPSKLPSDNLVILFDAKLQSYFANLAESGAPDTSGIPVWYEDLEDVRSTLANHQPHSLKKALAYINGCDESEVKDSGERRSHPEHPNCSYQFSLEEAEFLCVELQLAGRCVFTPKQGDRPSLVDRPSYKVHPEDRIIWRYLDEKQFRQESMEYMNEILKHYHNNYNSWSAHRPDRPGFSRELQYMLDHAGPDFTPELERIETQDNSTEAERLSFIKLHLVPETVYRVGSLDIDGLEVERGTPCWDDLATWEETGALVTNVQKQQKELEDRLGKALFYSREPYRPQTAERTVQFLRNLAYRMGRTISHVEQIRDRLQYLDKSTRKSQTPTSSSLDLSSELKWPRPENGPSVDDNNSTSVVQRWWHALPVKDYDLAIKHWVTAVEEGFGEVALLPPKVDEVLAKADPTNPFRTSLKEQDAFGTMREGIIDDCVQNRPTMYPIRLSGFKDGSDKEFQGFERPNLFEWATKEQRRYQAQHTRQHFFNMQRWPLCRLPPHRLEAIRTRKDEIIRHDPSRDDQAYGILTHRLPVGKEKPIYVHPIIIHRASDEDYHLDPGPFEAQPDIQQQQQQQQRQLLLPQQQEQLPPSPWAKQDSGEHSQVRVETNNNNNNMTATTTPVATPATGLGFETRGALVPYKRSTERFAPGPAVFPMGDTLLQKIWVSNELSNTLYPKLPLYKESLLGIPKLWRNITRAKKALIPLVPEVSKAMLPRSNPKKRKMPIEFLNTQGSTKKFRSDVALGLQPGGSGGQFAAAIVGPTPVVVAQPKRPVATPRAKTKTARVAPVVPVAPVAPVESTPTKRGIVRREFTQNQPQQQQRTVQESRRENHRTDGRLAYTPRIVDNPPQTIKEIAPQSGVPEYADVPLAEAYEQNIRDFPHGWTTPDRNIKSPFLFTSAMIALENSINRQLQRVQVQTNGIELEQLLALPEAVCVKPFTNLEKNNFTPNCLSHMLDLFGRKHDLKLQLGIIHEDPQNRKRQFHLPDKSGQNSKSIAFILGSKYNNASDKKVIWVRLANEVGMPFTGCTSPYINQPYNTYKAVAPRHA